MFCFFFPDCAPCFPVLHGAKGEGDRHSSMSGYLESEGRMRNIRVNST